MALKFDSDSPIYLQIAKYFQVQVFLGNFISGQVIPSRRDFAGESGVNLNTVQKAYSHMEEIGLIVTRKNRYSYITNDIEKISELRESFIFDSISSFIHDMKMINIEKEELLNLVDVYYESVEDELKNSDEKNNDEGGMDHEKNDNLRKVSYDTIVNQERKKDKFQLEN